MPTALLVVDAQCNMLEGEGAVSSAAEVTDVLRGLLARARSAHATVVHVQNDGPPDSPDEPHTAGWELLVAPVDGELVVRKDQSDAFAANPTLAQELRVNGVERMVVAGLQSEYCIQATARGAARAGFAVVVPRGGHATYDDGPQSAADIAQSVEDQLSVEGIWVLENADVEFA